MSNKKKLWNIFGPVIIAFLLFGCVLLLPMKRHFSNKNLYEAATSQNENVFKGIKLKQQAFKKNYVPFYGSSELSRIDPLHPSIIAKKYHRNYRPFLLGSRGTQSLLQYMDMQGTAKQLRNKKAVVIISPQWFTEEGQNHQAFAMYYSPLQTTIFLLHAKNNKASRYAAQRLLDMDTIKDGIIKSSLEKVAKGQELSSFDKQMLSNKKRVLENEDTMFSTIGMQDRLTKINRKTTLLPKKYSIKALNRVANHQAEIHTTSNGFGIHNNFYKKNLSKGEVLKKLKGSQKNFNYVESPEYADFELMLQQFAKQHTNVLFVIPPVNAKWAKYTGLSTKMYENSVAKIQEQLISQGFYNIEDLSKYGSQKYFMEDTIHLGWRGWVAVDQAVKPFMDEKNTKPTYDIQNYYYSKQWQNKEITKSLESAKSKAVLRTNLLKGKISQTGIKGNALAVQNGKVVLDYTTEKNITSSDTFLINSTQKLMTASLVAKAVQDGKLKYTDHLSKWLPSIPRSEKITISDLLQMRSGLVLDSIPPKLGAYKYTSDKADLQSNLSHTVFIDTNYGKWRYDSLNYVYLSNILSKIYHKSYEELFDDEYIDKLHLKNTAFYWDAVNDPEPSKSLTGHRFTHDHWVTVNTDKALELAHHSLGAGSITMSNQDMIKVINYIFNGGMLTKKSKAYLFKGKAPSYYNGGLYNLKNYHVANGAGSGFYTFIRISNDGKKILVIQSNHTVSGRFTHYKKQVDKVMNQFMYN